MASLSEMYPYWHIRPEMEEMLRVLPFMLGAQKVYRPDGPPRLRFGVYSPNARKVEVVFPLLWNGKDPGRKPITRENPVPMADVYGAYVADDGFGIDPAKPVLELQRDASGCWFSKPDDPRLANFADWVDMPYMLRVTKDDGTTAYRSDIYSRGQLGGGDFDPKGAHYEGPISNLAGTKSSSLITDPETVIDFAAEEKLHGTAARYFPATQYLPQDDFWRDEFVEGNNVPCRTEDLIIYQLHTASLGFGHTGVGTLDDAIALLDHLVEMGVNAVEFLPMSEYGGKSETWGYSTSHFFAIEFSGGGRDKFKEFVKACHRRGIAVIFDVVYNHFAHDAERAEWLFDSDAHDKNFYYWYHGKPGDYAKTFAGTGGYLDNLSTGFAPRYDSPYVGGMFMLSAVLLLKGFHVDGFRADQTTSIHQYNVLHADGSPMPDANEAGCDFLRKWTRTLKAMKPQVMLIAEDHSNWDAVTQPVAEGGLGFDAIWYADFHHHLCGANYGSNYAKLLPTAGYGGDGPLAMSMFAKALQIASPQKIVYHISHDEAGNSGRDDPDPHKRSHRTLTLAVAGIPDAKERPIAEARARVAFGLAIASPGSPMFLFGEEVGFVNDFYYDKVLAYREDILACRETTGKEIFEFYKDAIRLRSDHVALRLGTLEILHVNDANRVLAFRRTTKMEELIVVASLNNHPFDVGYDFNHPSIEAGKWQIILDSDLSIYGGQTEAVPAAQRLESEVGTITVILPANTLRILQRYA